MTHRSTFLFAAISIFIFISCKRNTDCRLEQIPNEYEYIQRAYPHLTINHESVIQVRKDVQKIIDDAPQHLKNNNPWENNGPTNIGGRITDIARHPTDSETFYIGCSVGGVFKTIDGGNNWVPVFDDVISPSIGNIGISLSNPDVIYVGTGEANGSGTSGAFFGTGIYKSTDAGETWNSAGLEQSNHIGRLVVDKNDPDIVYAAATGKLYGKGTNRGLYKTTNGGDDWQKILFVSDSTACIDVAVHPTNSDIIYAVTWERHRFPWGRDYGGPTSAIFKSEDSGQNWTRLENGLPQNIESRGRIGISISQSNPDVLFASITDNEITNVFEGLYRTDDGGESWVNATGDLPGSTFSSFGWFFGNVRVDPKDDNNAYVLGLNAFKTSDKGESWAQLNGMHVDMHALEFFQQNSDDILIGNDGGLYRSLDGGENFSFINNIPLTQFYNIDVDFQLPERVFGGTQDNNTIGTFTGAVDDYQRLLGGDGFHVIVDPRNSDIIYAESQFGNLRKSIDRGASFQRATDGIDGDDRTNWNTPVVISPFNPSLMFYGSQKLYTSIEATQWTAISEDLSQGQHPSGSMTFGTLTTIAPSFNNDQVIYVGTDDGQISVTKNAGLDWESIDDGIPQRYITKISVNPSNDAEAIVSFSGYQYLDYLPHLMITYDYGQTWSDITGNLPPFPINDIEYNLSNDDELFIATDMGVWYSVDKGLEWNILGKGLPPTIVKDIKIHGPTNTLYAGTFGRSIYNVNIEDLTSISDVEALDQVKLFPNPSSENQDIFIDTQREGSWNVSVYTLKGQLIKTLTFSSSKFSIGAYESGTYIVKLENANNVTSSKLIVK